MRTANFLYEDNRKVLINYLHNTIKLVCHNIFSVHRKYFICEDVLLDINATNEN